MDERDLGQMIDKTLVGWHGETTRPQNAAYSMKQRRWARRTGGVAGVAAALAVGVAASAAGLAIVPRVFHPNAPALVAPTASPEHEMAPSMSPITAPAVTTATPAMTTAPVNPVTPAPGRPVPTATPTPPHTEPPATPAPGLTPTPTGDAHPTPTPTPTPPKA